MLVLFFIGMSLATSEISYAKIARPILIGALSESWGPTSGIVGLRDGLVQLGYHENKDFVLGVRFTQGDNSALPGAAQDLIEAGADLLFADSNITAKALQRASAQIPIVFVAVEDPVGSGLVKSYAEPRGNLTGVATLDTELGPKRLQLFYELIPMLKRNWLRVLGTAEMPHINHRVGHQFHRIVPTLEALKPHQEPLEFVLPGKRPLHSIS
jgi:putative ABC transport system substrate-binding protein